MKRLIGKMLIIAIVPFFLMAFSWGGNKPKESELKNALAQQIPGFVRVTNFTIEALQNYGNEVEPRYRSRFKATVEAADNLYKGENKKNNVLFVRLQTSKGKRTDIFGKTTSVLYQGAWQHSIEIDGNPIGNLGGPMNLLSGERVIVRGSDEEKSYYAEVERKNKEMRAEAERKEAEQLNNLANAAKILIGSWRDENSLITYKTDGSRMTKFDSGNTIFSKWQIDGDIIVRRDEMKETTDGKSVPLNRTWRVKILYIDNNKYTIKDDAGTWTAKRVK